MIKNKVKRIEGTATFPFIHFWLSLSDCKNGRTSFLRIRKDDYSARDTKTPTDREKHCKAEPIPINKIPVSPIASYGQANL